MAFIEVVEPEVADGRLKEIYEEVEKKRGKIADVYKIQSLNPESIVKHMDLYLAIMFDQSPLERAQREMLGVVVSIANQCQYCQEHHARALEHFWKNEKKVQMLMENHRSAGLSETNDLLCSYARELTKHPGGEWREESYVQPLRDLGLTDRAILDATLVISYFNFVNRMVLALGLEIEENPGGYIYDL